MVDKVTEAAVVGGVDTHKDLHVAAVVDQNNKVLGTLNRPGFPGECFICELRLPDHRFRWK
ncbi:hypothetical protein SNC51_04260, partial [Escherichia coli]|nr:hypothetical protein [Escherichia coli]